MPRPRLTNPPEHRPPLHRHTTPLLSSKRHGLELDLQGQPGHQVLVSSAPAQPSLRLFPVQPPRVATRPMAVSVAAVSSGDQGRGGVFFSESISSPVGGSDRSCPRPAVLTVDGDRGRPGPGTRGGGGASGARRHACTRALRSPGARGGGRGWGPAASTGSVNVSVMRLLCERVAAAVPKQAFRGAAEGRLLGATSSRRHRVAAGSAPVPGERASVTRALAPRPSSLARRV